MASAGRDEGPPDCLRSLGITHVLVGRGLIAYYMAWGLDPSAVRLDALDQFGAYCLQSVFEVPGTTAYRVAPSSADSR